MSSMPDLDPSGDDRYKPMPRWVRWALVGAVALVVLAIFAALILGADHGPGRHAGQLQRPLDWLTAADRP